MSDLFEMMTYSGYDFFEVSSALQKSIRRGLEEDAIYWALELEDKYGKYLWKRLIVMANEEIGIANPSAVVLINAWKDQYVFLRSEKKDRHRLLVLGNAILYLCRSKKSRIGDDFITCAVRTQHDGKKEIPDYALDAHTLRGKKMGRGWDADGDRFWFEVSSVVENEVEGLNTYLEDRKAVSGKGFKAYFD